MSEQNNIIPPKTLESLRERYEDSVEDIRTENTDVPIVYIKKEKLISFLGSLRSEEGFEFNFLADLTAVDFNPPVDKIPDYGLGHFRSEGDAPRFEVIYQMLSLQNKFRLRIKVRVGEGEEVPSVTDLWKSANWLEREVWDLYGIRFSGHPDLTRIMLDERWQGHPQRKDYPIKRYQRWEDSLDMAAAGLEE